MATGKVKTEEKPPEKEGPGATFLCKFCGRSRPLDEMRILAGFFPPLIACRNCERAMR